jgi:hypothetical protein
MENTENRLIHSHQWDNEPYEGNIEPSPYMCRACEQETGDPYAFTKDRRGNRS